LEKRHQTTAARARNHPQKNPRQGTYFVDHCENGAGTQVPGSALQFPEGTLFRYYPRASPIVETTG
jgi:hypothetical protein